MARLTYHLVAVEDWPRDDAPYAPASLAAEGFVHCTDGRLRVIETANRYYRGDARSYLLIALDLDALTSPWRYDDPERVYPHVYGPIERAAVVSVHALARADDGEFLPAPVDVPESR